MNLNFNSIAKSLNKAYLKQDITEADFYRFKNALLEFFKNHNPAESEEHQKNNIAEFFKNAFYKDTNLINTRSRIDLAIYNGLSANDTVGVLIEVKSTRNKSEMISQSKPNAKALQEAIAYYLEESISHRNKDIKHIIITNSEEWYFFDGAEFEREFYKNSYLNEKFSCHREELFGVKTTEWFYTYLQNEIIPKIENFNCTYINFSDYQTKLESDEFLDELIKLYKILSPEHLLKKPFANDSNTLDIQFYEELLHLIGIEEVKDSGKKILLRLPENRRQEGSLLENAIRTLKVNASLERVKNIREFGKNEEEQLFSVGLELCITWLNRILFLKLLEGQLIKFNDNDYSYKFLTLDKIEDFDELNELFFEVLALKPNDRAKQDIQRFAKIPYLNSSLFEQTALEKDTITISSLKDRLTISLHSQTVLKSLSGDRRTGKLRFQEYLFEFLDSYNFANVSKATIQPESKTIINSSVLGLIFEKLNGYKDGSFFTPGYITMYMCRESISLAVVQKFNEKYNWNCKNLTDLYNKLDTSKEKLIEYNSVMNSIRLVDPAVGSGHFLVSALNEFINIKAELGILIDKSGKRLKDYKFYIENDELIIIDENDNVFAYLSPEKVSGARRDELQKVQETIFHEKQTIIENCLFGVDINPKSVSISRLRLWIELLKFMYYNKCDNNTYELETLPNIDINIKTGNSLLSRFNIDDNASLTIADAKIIPLYKQAVLKYKNVRNYKDKKKILAEIENYKSQLKGFISAKSAKFLKLNDVKEELKKLTSQTDMFKEFKTKKEEKEFTEKVNKLTSEIKKLEYEVSDLNDNPIYSNAFEWRFEFPEVLNDKGDYIGFDLVIGNPPYGVTFNYRKQYNELFDSSEEFLYISIELVKKEGYFSFIVPKSILFANSWKNSRMKLLNYDVQYLTDTGLAFKEVNIETIIYLSQNISFKSKNQINMNKFEPMKRYDENKILVPMGTINQKDLIQNEILTIAFFNDVIHSIINKVKTKEFIKDHNREVFRGLYIPDSYKEKNLDKGLTSFVNKVPDVTKYKINLIRKIDLSNLKVNKIKIEKMQRNRIIIKVLRGKSLSATYCTKDVLTTEKLVNLIIENINIKYVLSIINHYCPTKNQN